MPIVILCELTVKIGKRKYMGHACQSSHERPIEGACKFVQVKKSNEVDVDQAGPSVALGNDELLAAIK